MKKANLFLAMLLLLVSSNILAQYSEAHFRIYEKGYSSYSYFPATMLDSIAFVPENYDVWVNATPQINEDGTWGIKIQASWSFSVGAVQVCIVPASYTEEDILAAYDYGTLPNMRTLKDSVYATEYTIEDGTYKPVAFGLDKAGKMRSHYIGEEVALSQTYLENILKVLMHSCELGDHYDWGYGSIMHIRDLMGEDLTQTGNIDYSHYKSWLGNRNLASNYRNTQFTWLYFDSAIRNLSNVIDELNVGNIANNPTLKQYLAVAVTMRAMHYLDAARMYEYLPTDGTSHINAHGNDVTNLTYPIRYSNPYGVDSTTTVRRATREEMKAYIEEQLNWAENLHGNEYSQNKEITNKSVVFGLKARMYMWVGDYAKAQLYAEKAMAENKYQVLTEAEWHDTNNGFNNSQAGSWMWAMRYKEGKFSSLMNWISWCSNQTFFGYTGMGTALFTSIGTAVYNNISDTDFRKKSFKAPEGSPLYGTESYPAGINPDDIMPLASLKFRPGKGNIEDYNIGAATDVPLMRIEEMHFIRMEAIAQQGNWQEAEKELTTFMRTFRDPNYFQTLTSKEDVISEIFNQKRIEFWGEGLNFFDYKRLNKPVTRDYDGTNYTQNFRFNTTTRPAWMNFVFVMNAYNGAIEEWNNPDPSNCYVGETR